MITTMRMSAPTPKSAVRPTPHRPAQATPVRRERVGEPGGCNPVDFVGGITPRSGNGCGTKGALCNGGGVAYAFAGGDDV